MKEDPPRFQVTFLQDMGGGCEALVFCHIKCDIFGELEELVLVFRDVTAQSVRCPANHRHQETLSSCLLHCLSGRGDARGCAHLPQPLILNPLTSCNAIPMYYVFLPYTPPL